MRFFLFLLVLTTLIVIPASADNITIEVLENFDGDLFIEFEDNRTSCSSAGICTFDIGNYTSLTNYTEFELSKDDKKDIGKYTAQYLSLELDLDNIVNDLNKSYFDSALMLQRNEIADNTGAKIKNSFVPDVENLKACEFNLSAAQGIIKEERAKIQAHDATIAGKDAEIKSLERDLKKADLLVIGFGLLLLLSVATRKHALRNASDFLKNRGK